ncbi:hypothetical protein OG978_14895 [Streptomyces sp. NBC_01591]|uniref:hypothetical protein n=1 Tax=Streptomyces sp. NBC_01591 TaxID=2975888 RepID=UPI002DD90BAF|nr:hypothetical protein [Streptomyces sp. NBC_01591]WSD68578.1 hypothetical protein OG978_14895 [Streptomyces sp. NBC_01591]
MLQLRNAQGPRGRLLVGRTLLASALLTAVAAVPAVAAAPQAPATAASARSDIGAPAYQQVAHFYGAYIDAVMAEDGGRLTTALRTFYLTPHLRSQLNTWEQRNHADGVLRAQNTPLAFRVTPGDSAAGHTWSTVRLTWSGGKHPTYSYLTVRSDLQTGKISGIGQ